MAPRISFVDTKNSNARFFDRLWIYDASEDIFRDMVTANDRADTYILPIRAVQGVGGKGAIPNLADWFDTLVRDGFTFRSAVFVTHGKSGKIRIDGDDFDAQHWKRYFAGRGHERLFPRAESKVYFAACDVADSEGGWKFLEAAGAALLRGSGGLSYGWTSLGIAAPSYLKLIGGHAVHLWGHVRYVKISPGGASERQPETEEADPSQPTWTD